MLTATEAADIRAKIERFEAWLGKRCSYRVEELPAGVPQVSNEERSALEVFEFLNDPPIKYFLYIKEGNPAQAAPLVGQATTWTGDRLGYGRFGRSSRSNMGDVRVPVTISAINGRTYVGTYFKSAGDYARIRLAKGGK